MEDLHKVILSSKVELRVRDDLGVVWRPGAAGMDGDDGFTFVARGLTWLRWLGRPQGHGRTRRCALRPVARGSASTPTTARSRQR